MTTFRWLAVCILAAMPTFASALVWPGAAPCDGPLQACINSATAGAIVEVASNSSIDETLFFGIPLTLRAASGYSPQLALDRGIIATANDNGTYAIEGFTLSRGFVSVTHNAGNANVRVRRIRVLATTATGSAQISLYSPAATPLTYELAENDLSFAWNTYDGALHAAMQVSKSSAGTSDGRIRENRVDASGAWATGILVINQDNAQTARLYGNWVRGGGNYGSIDLRQGNLVGSGGGSLNAYVVNNVVTPMTGGDPQGIKTEAYFGSLNLQAFNNTVTGALYGVDVYVASGVVANGRIANNLLAGDTLSVAISHGGTGTISNDHNLLYGGSVSGTTTGAGTVTANPQLRGAPGNPWLNATSPAIDAADSLSLDAVLTSAAIARVDGAGLRRFKGGSNLADIGALEFGDTSFLHRVNNPAPSIYSEIDDASLNGLPSHFPQITANWNPDGASGIYDNHPASSFYSSVTGHWNVRNEDLATLAADTRFNVFSPAYGNGLFNQVVTAANIVGDATSLSGIGGLDNQPNRILLATRDSLDPDATTYDDPHPFGVFYFALGGSGNWFVSHFDSTAMDAGGGYHVYWQEPSANAFIHTATAGNSAGDYTVLDHPLLNGHRCARFQFTPGVGGSVFNAHQTGVFYFGNRWAIFNQDLSSIPTGTTFHVVIDAQQVFECSDVIFTNAFE